MILIVLLLTWSCGVFADGEWDYLCEGLDPYTKLPHPYDCKKHIQCMEEGTAFLGECGEGTSYDIKVKNCLPDEFVDCSHITVTSTEGTTSAESSPETTTESGWDYLCKGVQVGSLVGHPYDCQKFFQCIEDEQAAPGNCLENEAFDKDKRTCLPESEVDCSHIISTTEPTSTTPETTTEETSSSEATSESTEETTTESSTESSETPTTAESTTPEETSTDPPSSTEEPTTTEMTSTTEEITTVSTTEESTTEEITTTSEPSSTESSPTPTTPEPTASTDSSSTPTVTYPPGTSISPGPEFPEPGVQCPPLSKTQGRPVFLASKIDCSKYYLCYIGLPVALKCQTGTHFNQFDENCDDPFFAHCQVKGFVDPNPYPECPRRGTFNLPRVDNCEYFVHCNEGVGRLQKCPFYYGWDILTQRCLMSNFAVCA